MKIAEDLSVVIPNYNCGEYLYESISCVYAQELVPAEILIVDDVSTDHSHEVIETIRSEYPRTRVHFNECNLGANQTITKALSLLGTRYVAPLGADDPLHDPAFFAKAMPLLRQHPDVAFAFGEYRMRYDLGGEALHCGTNAGLNSATPVYIDRNTFHGLFLNNIAHVMPTQPSIWLREEWRRCGGLIAELYWHADVFAALVLGFERGACFFPGMSQTVRVNSNSISRDPVLKRDKTQAVIQKILDLLDTPEFSHARPIYKAPPALGRFGFDGLNYLIRHPERREYLTFGLLRSVLQFEHLTLDLPAFISQFAGKRVTIETIAQELLHAASKQLLSGAQRAARHGQFVLAAELSAKALRATPDSAECREAQQALRCRHSSVPVTA